MIEVDREQVLAYRFSAQQLDRSAKSAGELTVLDIGVQDGAGEQARLAFDARLATTAPRELFGDDALALVWSLRGAPHVHRRADLDDLAHALYPLSEQDAAGRLNETGPSVARAGIAALDQFSVATKAMRQVVSKPVDKGAASTAVSRRVPPPMLRDCRVCKAKHVSDPAMRSTALAAGLELRPGTAPPVLLRRAGGALVARPSLAGLRRLVLGYLRLLGPATPAHVADYFGARTQDLMRAWPHDLAETRVGRSTRWLPADCVARLTSPTPATGVRLLGGYDPFLQARDRDLLVPDKAAHKTLWPVLGRPGAVLVDGEVVGAWRAKTSGATLTVTVAEFGAIAPPAWTELESEAERVAAVRGASSVVVAR